MNLSSRDFDFDFLLDDFPGVNFRFYTTGDDLFITCIACWFESESMLLDNWRGLQSLISAYYRPAGDFAKWNIYLIFFCKEAINIREKYFIQNNRYGMRKLILDDCSLGPEEDSTLSTINAELMGADLELNSAPAEGSMDYASEISRLVLGAPIGMSKDAKEQRADIIERLISEAI